MTTLDAEKPAPVVSLRTGVLLGAVSLLLPAAVAAGLRLAVLPLGSREWAWGVRTPPRPWTLPTTFALLGVILLALLVFEWVRAPRCPTRRTCAGLLAALLPLSLLIVGGIVLTDPIYPVTAPVIVLSDIATGYYGAAASLGPCDILGGQLTRARDTSQPDRVRTHPPGPILFMWTVRELALTNMDGLARLEVFLQHHFRVSPAELIGIARFATKRHLTSTDVLLASLIAWLLTLLPVLIYLPAYGLGTALADRRVGLAAAALALCMPALWCFLPGIDGVGALLALTALWLWAAALRGGSWWRYALAGLGFALALFWSFGYLALGPVALFLAGRSRESRPANLAAGLVFTLAAFALVYGALDAACGYNLLTSMAASLAAQRLIMVREQRAYLTWLGLNPYAFLLFVGPALWPGLVVSWVSRAVQSGFVARLTQGTLLTLAGLILLGSTRGEVERIWVFLIPLLTLPLAVVLTRLPRHLALWLPALLLALQIAFAVFLANSFMLVTAT